MVTPEKKDGLDRQDLYLLMDAYKNTIEPLTIIIEQNKNNIEKLNDVNENLKRVIGLIDEYTKTMHTTCGSFHSAITKNGSDLSKEHEDLKGRVHLIYLGMAGIILALIVEFIKVAHSQQGLIDTVSKLTAGG